MLARRFTAGLAAAVLVLFAGLLPLGHWYSDEYDIFHAMAGDGWHAAWQRFYHWSPRPASELLIYGYGRLVLASHQPLIGLALAGSLGLLLLAATWPLRSLPARRRADAILVTLTMCGLCLLGHAVARVFYWPVGSMAYVVTLAGAMGVFAESLRGEFLLRPWALGGWLLLAGLSSEIGAMFALAYGLLGCGWARSRWHSLLPAMIGAAAVLVLVMTHRGGGTVEQVAGGGAVHALFSSVKSTLLAMWPNWWYSSLSSGGWAQLLQVISKLALWVGVAALASSQPYAVNQQRALWLLAAASAAMVPATIFAAYFQFGLLCCEHHDTVRQCFMVIAVAAAGIASGGWMAGRGGFSRYGAGLLAVALLAGLLISGPWLWADYRQYRTIYQVQQSNWQSGQTAGRELWIQQHVPGQLTGGPLVAPAGEFGLAQPIPAALNHQALFFGKQAVRVEPLPDRATRRPNAAP